MDQSTNILQCEQQQLSMSVVPVPSVVLRGSREASPVHSAPTAMRKVVLDSEKETMMEEKETRMEEKMMMTKAARCPGRAHSRISGTDSAHGSTSCGTSTDEEAMKGSLLQCFHQSIETACALVVMHYVVEQSVQRQIKLRLGVSKQCGGERKTGGDRLLSPLPRSGEVKEPFFALNTRRRVRSGQVYYSAEV
jgi:hypothetical protein